MTAYEHWHNAETLMSTGPGADGCYKIVITCASKYAADKIHDHIVASFNDDANVVEQSCLSVEVDGEYLAIHEVDDGMVAALDPKEARAIAATLLRLADETVPTGLMDGGES